MSPQGLGARTLEHDLLGEGGQRDPGWGQLALLQEGQVLGAPYADVAQRAQHGTGDDRQVPLRLLSFHLQRVLGLGDISTSEPNFKFITSLNSPHY